MVERVLTDCDVDRMAHAPAPRLAEIVSGTPGTFAEVDGQQLARDLGVSRGYLCAHATGLGVSPSAGTVHRGRLPRSMWWGSSRAWSPRSDAWTADSRCR